MFVRFPKSSSPPPPTHTHPPTHTQHLLKRSLLLVKAWCMYDSHKSSFTGSSVLGQLSLSNGSSSLSEYALCVMVLSLFNLHYRSIKFPVCPLLLRE